MNSPRQTCGAFQAPIAADFKERGYQCFTNVAEGKNAGDPPGINPRIAEMQSVVEWARSFIGIHSGSCDVIRYYGMTRFC